MASTINASTGPVPGLISTGDNSGVIELQSDGVTKMTVSSTGVSLPALAGPAVIEANSSSAALRVTQTGAGNALVVEDSANPDSTPFVVDADGRVGIGTSTALSTNSKVIVGGTLPSLGTVTYAIHQNGTFPQASTGAAVSFLSTVTTENAAGTMANIAGYYATQGTISGGSRSTPTNQFGVIVDSTLTGATNNYGIYSNIPSGSGRWNFFSAGTASNYFAGNVGIGTTAIAGKLDVVTGTYRAYFDDASGASVRLNGVNAANNAYGPLTINADQILFTTNTTERVRIASTGALGLSGANYGTSGQILTSNGSGAAPSWQSPAGGGSWIYLGAITGSGASTIDAEYPFSSFNATYDVYVLVCNDFYGNWVGGADRLVCRAKVNGSYLTSNYRFDFHNTQLSAQWVTSGGASYIDFGPAFLPRDTDTGNFSNFEMYLWNAGKNQFQCFTSYGTNKSTCTFLGASVEGTQGALQGLRFYGTNSPSIWGTIRLYGIKKS